MKELKEWFVPLPLNIYKVGRTSQGQFIMDIGNTCNYKEMTETARHFLLSKSLFYAFQMELNPGFRVQ